MSGCFFPSLCYLLSFSQNSWGVVVSAITAANNEDQQQLVSDSPKENIPVLVNKQFKARKVMDSSIKDDVLSKKRRNRSSDSPVTFDDVSSLVVANDEEEECTRPTKKAPVKSPRLSDPLMTIPVTIGGSTILQPSTEAVPVKPEVKKGRFNRFASFGPIVDSLTNLK
jgi:ribosomal protein L14